MIPGLESTRLSNYETGLRMLDIEIAKRLGALYGVPAAYLLTLEEDPPDPNVHHLHALYLQADARGKQSILRTAEFEAATSSSTHETDGSNSAAGEQGQAGGVGATQRQLMTQIYEQVCGQDGGE